MTRSKDKTPPSKKSVRNQDKSDSFEVAFRNTYMRRHAEFFHASVEEGLNLFYAFREYTRRSSAKNKDQETLDGFIVENIEVKFSSDSETRVHWDYLSGSVTLYIPESLPDETPVESETRKVISASIMTSVLKEANDRSFFDLMLRIPVKERENFIANYKPKKNE